MAAGECWIFDTWRQHRVLNDAVQSRIHLVCDTVGGGAFWDSVAQGRAHDAPREGWMPKRIAPDPSAPADFACETMNVPAVMSPWELKQHLSFLLDEALPHAQLPALRQRADRLIPLWKGLWAQYGDAAEGRALFLKKAQGFLKVILVRRVRAAGHQRGVVVEEQARLGVALLRLGRDCPGFDKAKA